jgi:hypothetical protein
VGQPAEVAEVLDVEGRVQSEPLAEGRPLLLGRLDAEEDGGRVAGDEAQGDEDEGDDDPQERDELEQPARDVPDQARPRGGPARGPRTTRGDGPEPGPLTPSASPARS